MAQILIAGGSGLIGRHVTDKLLSLGHKVIHLSRNPKSNTKVPTYKWDIKKEYVDPAALEGTDYLINLAGTGIADKRWTASRKEDIINSRVHGNLLFKKLITEKKLILKKFISGGAIGYYGDRGSEVLTEDSTAGTSGFLAKSCIAWEDSVNEVKETGVPTALLRIGIVLSTEGGALEKMLGPAKLGLGSYFGNGAQIYSWVHIDDISEIIIWLVENDQAVGTYNATAPNPVSNKQFVQEMMDVKGGLGIVAPVPSFVLSLMLGEMKAVVMTGSNVIPKKLLDEGYQFKYEDLKSSLSDLI